MSQTLWLTDERDPATQDKRVFIATPCYEGKPQGIYTYALLGTIRELEREGIGWEWCCLMYNCHVDDSRNTLVRNFRSTQCTDLFFIDADNAWEPDDFVRFMKMEPEFVAGVYPFKSFSQPDFPAQVDVGDIDALRFEHAPQGLVSALRVPTGFMRLRRSVLDKMIEAYGHRRYEGGDQREDLPHTVLLFERAFGPDPAQPEDNRRWGADWHFCNQWRALGEKIWIDPSVTLEHAGPWVWSGTIGDWWKKKTGLAREEKIARLDDVLSRIAADPWKAAADAELLVELWEAYDNPWASPPGQLGTLLQLALDAKGPTLECGTGASTALFAIAARATGRRHYALEHSKWWAADMLVTLRRNELAKHVEIVPAPLRVQDGAEWYDVPDGLGSDFTVLYIDGPPQELSQHVRWAALDKLHGYLAPGCVVVADDVDSKGWGDQLEEWGRLIGGTFHVMKDMPRGFAIGRKAMPQAVSEAS